ncbi:Ig-like domain-containing protein [Eubacterium sp.]|uniref:Ig-like domain-containing protein n=1 Tax=Eubacterium sp. TaxID=142586 RepID=UPI0026E097A7|nr:Ig-like domain-containing protein [Eubacterium sp.]MDO5434341.1 Ig-like domain-containing protein [Eubacterium sp.]
MENKFKLRRAVIWLLSLLIVAYIGLSATPLMPKVQAAAEDKVILSIDKRQPASRGQEIQVDIKMDTTKQPAYVAQFYIDYDSERLEFISGRQDMELWEGGMAAIKGTTGRVKGYVNSASGENEIISQPIMTMKFKVKDDAPSGEAGMTFSVDTVANSADKKVPYECSNGSVLVVSPITGVTLNKEKLSLTAGGSDTLTATVNPADTTDDKTIAWSAGNDKIAAVDNTGKVTAISAGTTDITATTVNGKTAKCSVTVSPMGTTAAQAPTATGITYGQKLDESTLSGGSVKGADNAEVKGTWQFKNPDALLSAGSQKATVVFIPAEPGKYSQCEAEATVEVAQLNITVTPAALEEGKVLGKTFGEKDGELTYTLSPALVGDDKMTGTLARGAGEDAGTYPINLGTLSAGDNYTLTLAEGAVYTVNKALPTFDPAPQVKDPVDKGISLKEVKYTEGKALDINGKALKGTFEWVDSDLKVEKSGNYKMRFIPDDPNYATMLIDVTVKVKGDDSKVPTPGAPTPESPQPHVTGGNPNTGILNNPAVLYPMAAMMLAAVSGCMVLYFKRIKVGKH